MTKFLINTYLNEQRKQPIVEVPEIAMVRVSPPFKDRYDYKYNHSGPDDFAYMAYGRHVFDTEEAAQLAIKLGPPHFWFNTEQVSLLDNMRAKVQEHQIALSTLATSIPPGSDAYQDLRTLQIQNEAMWRLINMICERFVR